MNNPFRYFPCKEISQAADNLIRKIDSDSYLHSLFVEGKMMGVLWVESQDGKRDFLYAFSGNVQGKNSIEGFVPPIYDLLDPKGYFKIEEARISSIDKKAKAIENSAEYLEAEKAYENSKKTTSDTLKSEKEKLLLSKERRNRLREESKALDPSQRQVLEAKLIKESQFEKAELNRLKKRLQKENDSLLEEFEKMREIAQKLHKQASELSDRLQNWIFHQFVVHNAKGDSKSIWDIFMAKGIVPPGGTGECAGPKLLEYAYRNNLKPLAMGEFWYGKTEGEELREHGHFYPSCQSKCGTLLPFMLEGLAIEKEHKDTDFSILFEDDCIIVADKPSGMLSVPGKDGTLSLLELLEERIQAKLYPVHRLDMDTSGVIVFAKDQKTQSALQKQFEDRLTNKEYIAVLDKGKTSHIVGNKGTIILPIRADYDQRPRQVVDKAFGKEAVTDFEIKEILKDGRTVVKLIPHTGRTHQLRVHCSHHEGLGCTISGDKLYGSSTDCKLCLKAYKLTFAHPISKKALTFISE